MITGTIRNKIDKIWQDIRAGGITNPITVIEQLTYMMFICGLDDKELETEQMEILSKSKMPKIFPEDAFGQSMRWHNFKDKESNERCRLFQSIIKGLGCVV